MWGLTIGFAAYGYSFYLLLTWLPGYLVKTYHMDIIKSGAYAMVPWIVAAIADFIVGGWLVDYLIKRGNEPTRVRKTIIVIGMLMGLTIIGARHDHESEHRDLLDHRRADGAGVHSAHRLVDPVADRAQRQRRLDRRNHELLQ